MTDGPQYPQYPGEPYPGEQPQQPQQPPAPDYGQPPPGHHPPGYNPPPPPGYHPPGYYPPQPGAYPPAGGYAPLGPYASWGSRVGAYLLDSLFSAIAFIPLVVVGVVILGTSGTTGTDINGNTTLENANPLGYVMIGLSYVVLLAFGIWNYVFRQGASGQTLGKSVVGIKVVRESGEPRLGRGLALGRMLLTSILTTFTCYLNLLWPLWDPKKQALHDKVISTVVIRAR